MPQGVVVWFDKKRGFGFIDRGEGDDAHFRMSAFQDKDETVEEGDTLEFEVEVVEGRRRPEAVNIVKVAEAKESERVVKGGKGVVKHVNEKRGTGVIEVQREDGKLEDVFFYATAFPDEVAENLNTLKEVGEVMFDRIETKPGTRDQAINAAFSKSQCECGIEKVVKELINNIQPVEIPLNFKPGDYSGPAPGRDTYIRHTFTNYDRLVLELSQFCRSYWENGGECFDRKLGSDFVIPCPFRRSANNILRMHATELARQEFTAWTLKKSVPDAVSTLVEGLQDQDADAAVREAAALALGEIGPDAQDAIPALVEALQDDDVRWAAAEALAEIGSAAVPALAEELRDMYFAVRWRVALALEKIGPAAQAAVPALLELLQREDNELVYCQVVWALGEIRDPRAIPALTKALQRRDEFSYVREKAAEALKKIKGE